MRIDTKFSPGALGPLAAPQAPTSVRSAAGAARRAEGGFALTEGDAERPGAPPARAAAPLATMDAILALQGEAGRDPERRRRSLRRGRDLLDGLDRLKVALLAGRLPTADLAALTAALARETGPSGDPGLDAVTAEIDLRAQVELAKLRARG